MNQEECNNLIRGVGEALIEHYKATGQVETGINGPYDDPETEVRYLAHLIVIAAIEFLKFNKVTYKPLIAVMGDRLLSMRQSNGIYKMRQKSGKDDCNGTIGHAWLVEGLLYAYKSTGNDIFLKESERILLMHEFNSKIGLWGRPLMGNDDNAIDFTFNHELWYAATVAEFLQYKNNSNLNQELNIFLKKLPNIITINKSGRIAHSIYTRTQSEGKIKYRVARMRDVAMEMLKRPNMKYKEDGYHLFNIMAFARLYKLKPECAFFKTNSFHNALSYVSNESFIDSLQSPHINMDCNSYGETLKNDECEINIYGYPYNVPGFEGCFCSAVFDNIIKKEVALRLLNKQFELTWNEKDHLFGKKCHDKAAVNYRLYEFYRYLEICS